MWPTSSRSTVILGHLHNSLSWTFSCCKYYFQERKLGPVPPLPERKWRWSCRRSIHSDMEVSAAWWCWRCWLKVETGALQTSHRRLDHHSPWLVCWRLTSAPASNSWSGFLCPASCSHSGVAAALRWSCSGENDRAERCEECKTWPEEWFGKAPNRWPPPGYRQTSSSLCSSPLKAQLRVDCKKTPRQTNPIKTVGQDLKKKT